MSYTAWAMPSSSTGTYPSGFYFLDSLKFLTGVDPDLIDLFIQSFHYIFYFQSSTCHFQIGQTVSLIIPCNLINLCPKLCRISLIFYIQIKSIQKFFHALRM